MTLEGSTTDDFLTLRIYLTTGSPVQRLKVINGKLVTAFGTMAGTGSRLHLGKNGTLIIVSFNEAVGRERWNYQTKYHFRDGAFQLAQLVYRSRDTINLSDRFDCDLDLQHGSGKINNKKISIPDYYRNLLLNEMTEELLGLPFDTCQQIAKGKLQPALAAHQLFSARRNAIAIANKAIVVIKDIHTGDINDDGRSDAIVSFIMTPEDGGYIIIGREAAIYLNQKTHMQVVGAVPATMDCGWSLTGINQGIIDVDFFECKAPYRTKTGSKKYRYCNGSIIPEKHTCRLNSRK